MKKKESGWWWWDTSKASSFPIPAWASGKAPVPKRTKVHYSPAVWTASWKTCLNSRDQGTGSWSQQRKAESSQVHIDLKTPKRSKLQFSDIRCNLRVTWYSMNIASMNMTDTQYDVALWKKSFSLRFGLTLTCEPATLALRVVELQAWHSWDTVRYGHELT